MSDPISVTVRDIMAGLEPVLYVLVRSPLEDDVAFTERLAEENVFVMPGKVFELP